MLTPAEAPAHHRETLGGWRRLPFRPKPSSTAWRLDAQVLHAVLHHNLEIDVSKPPPAPRSSACEPPCRPQITRARQLRRIRRGLAHRHRAHAPRQPQARLDRGRPDPSGDYRPSAPPPRARHLDGPVGELTIRRGAKGAPVKRAGTEAIRWLLKDVERGISKQRYRDPGRNEP